MTIDERLEFIATLQQTHDEQIATLIGHNDVITGRMDVLT